MIVIAEAVVPLNASCSVITLAMAFTSSRMHDGANFLYWFNVAIAKTSQLCCLVHAWLSTITDVYIA